MKQRAGASSMMKGARIGLDAMRPGQAAVRTWPRSSAAAEVVHEAATAIRASTWMAQRRPVRECWRARSGPRLSYLGTGLEL